MTQIQACPSDPTRAGATSWNATRALGLGCRARILVVDDDDEVREMIGEMLRAIDYEPTLASSAEDGLAILDHDDAFDLLLADYAMPGMNGIWLMGQVRDRHPAIRALLVTGHADLHDIAALSQEQVVRKPFGIAALSRRIEQALAASAPEQRHSGGDAPAGVPRR